MVAMKGRTFALALGAALACFGMGMAAERLSGRAPAPPPAPSQAEPLSSSASSPRLSLGLDAGSKDPKIVFDPDSIELLPDASLKLDLPPGFDGGAP